MLRSKIHSAWLVGSILAVALLWAGSAGADVLGIGLNIKAGSSGGLAAGDVAGAPGASMANWNNLYGGTGSGSGTPYSYSGSLAAGSVKLSNGTIAADTSVSWSYLGANGKGGNTLFGGTWDPFTNTSGAVSLTLNVNDIPFDAYGVYVYTGFGDTFSGRGGTVQIGSQTRAIQMMANQPSPDVYQVSNATAWAGSSTPVGTYVYFHMLTDPDLTIDIAAIGGNRFQIAGFQIVSVPEPSTVAMLLGIAGMGLIACLRRRR